MDGLVIREAQEYDLPKINGIRNYYVSETLKNLSFTLRTFEDALKWFTETKRDYPFFVAELDDLVVGYACLSSFRNFDGYFKTAEISAYLDVDYIGKGIGKLLFSKLIEEAIFYGFHCLVAVITENNEASIALHKKFDFEIKGVLNEVGFKNDKYIDVIFMTRTL